MSYLYVFLIGGLICVPAQILLDKTKLTNARILLIYLLVGIILGSVTLYKPLIEFASCGATVPLSGFGSVLIEGTKKSIDNDGLIGVVKGPLTAGSAGIATAIICGYLGSLLFKSRKK